MEKKLQKTYLTYCNLLVPQDLRQFIYQILLIISLKDFLILSVKNVKHVELKISIATVFLNTKILKIIS